MGGRSSRNSSSFMFIGIRNDFLNATLCSSSVNEFNVQLLEWGVFFFPGHVQWFVAAACTAAVFMVSLNALRCCPKGCVCSQETAAVLLEADRFEPSWHSEVWDERFMPSAHSRLHHAAQHCSFPEILFSLKPCLKMHFHVKLTVYGVKS